MQENSLRSKNTGTVNASKEKGYKIHKPARTRNMALKKRSATNIKSGRLGRERFEHRKLLQDHSRDFVYNNENGGRISDDTREDNYELYCKLYTLMVVKSSKGDLFMNIRIMLV